MRKMKSQAIKVAIGLVLAWLSIMDLMSQNVDIHVLDEKKGLSHNSQYYPNSTYEDKYGRIWIATLDGLNIYDGEEIRLFDIKTEEGAFPLRYVLTLGEGPSGKLWIATQHNGVFIYDIDTENIERFRSGTHYTNVEADIDAFAFFIDKEGRFLISSRFVIYEYDADIQLLLTAYEYPDKHSFLSDFRYLNDGRLILTTQNHLSILNDNGTIDSIFYGDILYSFITSDGRVKVVQNDDTEFFWDPVHNTFSEKTPVDCVMPCRQFRLDSIYLKSEIGKLSILDYYSDELISQIIEPDVPSMVSAIRSETDEIYYMSYDGGAGKISTFQSPFEPLANLGIFSIKKHEGHIYAATEREGLSIVEDSLSTILKIADLYQFELLNDGNCIVNQHIDYQGYTSLYGSDHDLISGPYKTILYDQIVQLSNGKVLTNITYNIGDEIDAQYIGDYINEHTTYDFKDLRVRYFMETMNGDLWLFKFGEGVLKISINSNSVIDPLQQVGDTISSGIYGAYYGYEGSDSTIYIAAENGLFAYDDHSWSKLNLPAKENHISITGIVEDENKNIWFMSRTRLFQYNSDTGEVYNYLLPELFKPNLGHPADMVAGDDGYIYYRSFYFGVSRFDPVKLIAQSSPDPVLITDLYIDRLRVTAGDDYDVLDAAIMGLQSFTVPYDYRDIGFSYASINADATDCIYYHRLVGYDLEWKSDYNKNSHYYTNLDPGDYTFEVKARASGGKWTENITHINFTVIPPWYRTYWAYGAYLLLCLLTAYGYYRYRIHQLMKYQRLRTKISSDLHDDVGSLLTAVAMQSEVLGLDAPPENIAKFDKLSRLSREAMGRMRDTVWAIDARKDNMESLIDRMEDYLSDVLDVDDPKLKYVFDKSNRDTSLKIAPDVRQNVYLIFKEAVNNAVKHSNGSHLYIDLRHSQSSISLRIKDNGRIDKDHISSSGLGMSNMKMRAERIQGSVHIDHTDGFKVELKAPLR